MMLSASSCSTRIKFDPDAYRANHYRQAIINEDEIVIYCEEEKFSEFACMHRDKWAELREILQQAPIDSKVKKQLLFKLDSLLDKEVKDAGNRRKGKESIIHQ